MRIAIFTETYPPYISSDASHTSVLAASLTRLGHKVLVVTSDLNVTKPVLSDGVLRCPAKTADNKFGMACSKPSDSIVQSIIEKFHPEVLHTHSETAIGQIALKYSAKYNTPIVFTIHSFFENDFRHDSKKLKRRIAMMKCKNRFIDMLDNADVISASSKKAEIFIRKCGRKRKIFLVPNDTDMVKFDYQRVPIQSINKVRAKLKIPQDATVAIFVGLLNQDKYIEALLEGWAQYVSGIDNIYLLIVGDGEEKPFLERWAHKLKLDNHVIFTGSIPNENMPEYYAASDIFVTASTNDMMSMAVSEAVSCGLPVVIKRDKDNPPYITDGVNGFIYRHPRELAEKVKIMSQMTREEISSLKKDVRGSFENINPDRMARYTVRAYITAQQARAKRSRFKEE